MSETFKLGVAFHSFTEEYCSCAWSFEDLMELTAYLGRGVEIVGPAHQRGFPHLTNDFERLFKSAVERFELVPTCYGSYADPFMLPDRNLSEDELVAYTLPQIDAAGRLGFPIVRLQYFVYPVIERLLPLAEKLGVKLGYELHAPLTLEAERTRRLVEQVKDLRSPCLGIIPDCGIFGRSIPEFRIRAARARGVAPELLEQALACWKAGMEVGEARKRLLADGLPDKQFDVLEPFWGCVGQSDPRKLIEVMPHIIHLHGKFFSIVDGDEPDLLYEEVVTALLDGGYRGWMSSEFEGARDETNSFLVLQEHQHMIRRYIDDYRARA